MSMEKQLKSAGKENGKRVLRRLAIVPLALSLMFSWAACGSAQEAYDTASNYAVSEGAVANGGGFAKDGIAEYLYTDSAMPMDAMSESSGEYSDNSKIMADLDQRKLIKTVHMDVETKEYDTVMHKLEQQINSLGGYIENSDTYNGSRYSGSLYDRYAYMTIRIPKSQLNPFLETISDISNVVRRSDNVEDVTLEYVDMESRRDTLKIEQERLLALLEKAEDLEAIIVLEKRLSEVRYQLESMESRLRTMDNQVDYSTVYLNISEVKELTPVKKQSAFERIAAGFDDSLKDIGEDAVDFAVWFVVNIPYFIVWGIVLVIFGVIISLLGKRSRRLRAEKEAKAKNAAIVNESGKKE